MNRSLSKFLLCPTKQLRPKKNNKNNIRRAVASQMKPKNVYKQTEHGTHHSDQQTVHTNFDLSVLEIQRPFYMLSFSFYLNLFLCCCISFALFLILLFSFTFRKEVRWLFAQNKKLSYHLICGLVLVFC